MSDGQEMELESTRIGLSLLDLPTEVIEVVVASPVLSLRDVCSLCRVNWRLHHIVSRIWARIAAARYVRRRSDRAPKGGGC